MPTNTATQRAAALLGRRGGQARAKALSPPERRRIARMGGRPPSYRLMAVTGPGPAYGVMSGGLVLQRRIGDTWVTLDPPYDRAAREALRRLRA